MLAALQTHCMLNMPLWGSWLLTWRAGRGQVAEKQAALAALQAQVDGAALASAANRGLIVDMQARST